VGQVHRMLVVLRGQLRTAWYLTVQLQGAPEMAKHSGHDQCLVSLQLPAVVWAAVATSRHAGTSSDEGAQYY
jgi:hypothetical protein